MSIIQPPFCLTCNYPLHGLHSHRCPECGRDFDPDDPWSMNIGRPLSRIARWSLMPIGRRNWWLTCAAAATIFWGWGSFPGGLILLDIGLSVLAMLQLYGLARLVLREISLRAYRQPRRKFPLNAGWRYRSAVLLIALFGCLLFDVPLYVSGGLTRLLATPRVHRMYAIDPMPPKPLGPQFIGVLCAEVVYVRPSGVQIDTLGGRTFWYDPDEDPVTYGISFGGGWSCPVTPTRELAMELLDDIGDAVEDLWQWMIY